MRFTTNQDGHVRVLVAAAAAIVVIGAIAVVRLAHRQQPVGGGEAVVQVDEGVRGAGGPRSFLGLSMEWDSVLPYAGPRDARRTGLFRVLDPVRRAAGAPLRLRIGGDTADQAGGNPSEWPRPPGVLQDVGGATAMGIGWLAK